MTTLTENNKSTPKVFVDTNVIIDALTERDNNFKPSQQLLRLIAMQKVKGYICSKQITDLHYTFRKYYQSKEAAMKSLTVLIGLFELLPLFEGDILASIHANMKDFEDALLDEIAKVNMIPYLITNNVSDFKNSKVPAFTPEQFLTIIQLK